MIKSNKKHQSGATILLFVVIMTISITLLLTTYLVILTRSSRNSYNQIRSEISYTQSLGTLHQSIIKHIKNPDNIWGVNFDSQSYTDQFRVTNPTNAQDTIIDRHIYKNNNKIIFDIQGTTANNPRTYEGIYTPPIITNPPVDIYLIIDTSDSMNEPATEGNPQSKINGAKIAANTFIEQFENISTSKIGIISYNTNANKNLELSLTNTNQSTLKNTINGLNATGSTNTSEALKIANQTFDTYTPSSPRQYIILLSDGIPTVYNTETEIIRCIEQPEDQKNSCMTQAYQETKTQANQLHLVNNTNVISIAYGSSQTFPSQIDSANLRSLSYNQKTGDKYYYHAPDAESLKSIFREIAIEIIKPAHISIDEITN